MTTESPDKVTKVEAELLVHDKDPTADPQSVLTNHDVDVVVDHVESFEENEAGSQSSKDVPKTTAPLLSSNSLSSVRTGATSPSSREIEYQLLHARIKELETAAEQPSKPKLKTRHKPLAKRPTPTQSATALAATSPQPAALTSEGTKDKPSVNPPKYVRKAPVPNSLEPYTAGMAPPRQKSLLKEKFIPVFSKLRTVTYTDTSPSRQPPPSHMIRTLSWNALGTLIATGAPDRTLRIWNPERSNVKYSTELRGHSGAVEKVEFNPTHESELASVSADGTVRLWDVRRKESIAEIKPNIGGVDLLAWRPDGAELIIGRQAKDTETPSVLIPISRSTLAPSSTLPCETPVSSLSFTHSTTNPSLLLCSTTGALTLHRYPDLSTLHTIRAHTSPLLSHSLNPPATLLATGGSDALITLWDTQDWVCVRKLDRTIGPVTAVSFSFDGSYVVGASDEGTGLDIAHAETGEYVHTIDTNVPSQCVQWHPHRYVLAFTSDVGLRIVGGMSTT